MSKTVINIVSQDAKRAETEGLKFAILLERLFDQINQNKVDPVTMREASEKLATLIESMRKLNTDLKDLYNLGPPLGFDKASMIYKYALYWSYEKGFFYEDNQKFERKFFNKPKENE